MLSLAHASLSFAPPAATLSLSRARSIKMQAEAAIEPEPEPPYNPATFAKGLAGARAAPLRTIHSRRELLANPLPHARLNPHQASRARSASGTRWVSAPGMRPRAKVRGHLTLRDRPCPLLTAHVRC